MPEASETSVDHHSCIMCYDLRVFSTCSVDSGSICKYKILICFSLLMVSLIFASSLVLEYES